MPEARQLLESAATVGEFFSVRLIEEMSPGQIDPVSALQSLVRESLVYEERSFPERQYAFAHGLVRQGVYLSTPPRRRAQLHRQALEAAEQSGEIPTSADACRNIATSLLGRGLRQEGLKFLQKAERMYRKHKHFPVNPLSEQACPVFEPEVKTAVHPHDAAINLIKVGRTYLALGERVNGVEAIRREFQERNPRIAETCLRDGPGTIFTATAPWS